MKLEVITSKPDEIEQGIENGINIFKTKLTLFYDIEQAERAFDASVKKGEKPKKLPAEFRCNKVDDNTFHVIIRAKGIKWLIARKLRKNFTQALMEIDPGVQVKELKG